MLKSFRNLSRISSTISVANSISSTHCGWPSSPLQQSTTLAGRKCSPVLSSRRNKCSDNNNNNSNQQTTPGRSKQNPFYRRSRTGEKVKPSPAKMSDPFRRWEAATRSPPPAITDGAMKPFKFTVMSYNVLAQDLIQLHPHLYLKNDPKYLKWSHRFEQLLHSFREAMPQILCLQEVQSTHLSQYIIELKKLRLTEHIYKQRTEQRTDGCAIFYDSELLELLNTERIEYFQPGVQILNRPNVAIIAKFRTVAEPRAVFVVATTHLLYNPRREDVRLAQIQVLLAEIDRMSYIGDDPKTGQMRYAPVILTGDFNLQPSSAPYRFLTQGTLQYEHLSVKTLENLQLEDAESERIGKFILPISLGITDHCQHLDFARMTHTERQVLASTERTTDIEIRTTTQYSGAELQQSGMPFSTGTLRHKLNLSSVYDDSGSTATTHQFQWITVDYIFYTLLYDSRRNVCVEGNLKLLSRYTLPCVDNEWPTIGPIPNDHYGSDHLSLIAKFALTND